MAIFRRAASFADSHWTAVIVGLLAVFTVVSVLMPHSTSDEPRYLDYADWIVDGSYWSGKSRNSLWNGPGLPILLTPFAAVGSPLGLTRFIFGPLAFTAAIAVFRSALLLQVSRQAATVGALALAVYLPVWRQFGVVMTEPLSCLLVALALLAWFRAERLGTNGAAAVAGLALGAEVLVRTEFGYVLLASALLACTWLLIRRRSRSGRIALVAVGVALAVCLPWLAFTGHVTGKPMVWGTAGGLNMYWMTHAEPPYDGKPVVLSQALRAPQLAEHWQRLRPAVKMDEVAQDEYFRGLAVERFTDQPLTYVRNAALSLLRLWTNQPAGVQGTTVASLVCYALTGVLLLVAVFGAALLITRRKLWDQVSMPVVAFAVVSLTLKVLAGGQGRYLVPLAPILIWFVARGACLAAEARTGDTPEDQATGNGPAAIA